MTLAVFSNKQYAFEKNFKQKSGLPRSDFLQRRKPKTQDSLKVFGRKGEQPRGMEEDLGEGGETLGRGRSQRLRPARWNKQRRLSHLDSKRLLLSRRAN